MLNPPQHRLPHSFPYEHELEMRYALQNTSGRSSKMPSSRPASWGDRKGHVAAAIPTQPSLPSLYQHASLVSSRSNLRLSLAPSMLSCSSRVMRRVDRAVGVICRVGGRNVSVLHRSSSKPWFQRALASHRGTLGPKRAHASQERRASASFGCNVGIRHDQDSAQPAREWKHGQNNHTMEEQPTEPTVYPSTPRSY